jgi:hypothetical protein
MSTGRCAAVDDHGGRAAARSRKDIRIITTHNGPPDYHCKTFAQLILDVLSDLSDVVPTSREIAFMGKFNHEASVTYQIDILRRDVVSLGMGDRPSLPGHARAW